MNPTQDQDREKQEVSADDEVGKPIWDTSRDQEPKEKDDDEEDDGADDIDKEYRVPPIEKEIGIRAPGFDPLEQQRWEEEEKRRREEDEEKERRENPRGVWQM
ncbi:hypothetical protein A2348_04245 [Candidatus Uhrbacteria bacterium RIFOXYB12_FULL_58_10]|uniref:Uncharacterized protein n=1 Tax=Candidatus Uhrbacteria bacterium RIFOXYB2_FULL_57_15 TaxID=1802422 RepID=A0A1F7WA30_9BACT|nr:MAG: hypothetical protein A2348_04245 [Candidatus Uhrbacteria bacterium RIFOXYB12_FULL_58_10]OGL99446.1 MAG: hypothetical protein A2304_02390 [Candidatus Uhrbacteria bacterium RIFOXYB2_FULL_57_15]OGL99887.1 MAG: hypothetical protein A2501_05140 [Candidatus Uhrbacteria bacterium RIFOXYC12_FULL_57_11]